MDRRTREAIRYLGYGKNAVDERTRKLITDTFGELEDCSQVRWIYRMFDVMFEKEDLLFIGPMKIKSEKLSKNVKDCKEAVVFAITLGAEVDRRLKRYAISEPARAVVLQACAAAYLETCCDSCQEQLEKELAGRYLRPRFSPGYGDFDISHQEEILQMLDAAKRIGLGRTESYMLVPTKSVTAIMGISEINATCHREGCEVCEKTDCVYRRN